MINFDINQILSSQNYLSGVVDPFLPILISKAIKSNNKLFLILRDDKQLSDIEKSILTSNPECKIISIPSWDTIPYDISSPNIQLLGKRMKSITNLINGNFTNDQLLILTT